MPKLKLKFPGRPRAAGPSRVSDSSPDPIPARGQLPSAWTLFKATWRQFRQQWRRYFRILGLIAIPVNLLSLINLFANDATTQSYVSFAAVVMNVALLWAIVQERQTGR